MNQLESTASQKPASGTRLRLHEIIFESDTSAGRIFDIALIWAILLSLALVMLESMRDLRASFGSSLVFGEWFFTILFTVELILRLYAVRNPVRYLFSFFGFVDLLAVVPTYLSLAIPGTQALLTVRAFRLLRVFRIFKLSNYMGEAQVLTGALRASRPKIIVFLVAVSATVVSMGALMYLVEGEENGFTSIPRGIYWAIVTMTTVGFGDITPKTTLGQFLASCLMIFGYGIIAIPTGIVTSELTRGQSPARVSGQACPNCGKQGHEVDAQYCKFCGSLL
jgi:voltage-gated potassium channel